jgi:hypothetical protein
MNKAELLEAIAQAEEVRAWCVLTPDDGVYLKTTKSSLLLSIEKWEDTEDAPLFFKAELNEGILYLD